MKVSAAILFLGVAVFCSPVAGADESVIYLRLSDSESLDPGKTTTQYSGEVVSNLFEGLVRYERDRVSIRPWLARRWEMLDAGKRWIFHLRQGVFFHDGSPFTADSVVYSFRSRMRDQDVEYPKWKVFFPTLTRIRAIDRHTVEITFGRPFAPLLTALSDPVAFVVPEGSYGGGSFRPVGTGPFKFSTWQRGGYIVLVRNERYWEKTVGLAKVTFKIVRNPVWRINQIKTGQAQVMEARSADVHAEFLGNREIEIIPSQPNNVFYLAFNTEKEPFDRSAVRQAFAHLIDKRILVRRVFQQFAIPATTPLPPHIPGFNPKIPSRPYDLGRARALLRLAGVSSGLKCHIIFLEGDPGEQKIVDGFVRNAKKIGIDLRKMPLPFIGIIKALKAGDFELVLRGWIAGPDPDIFLFSNFTMAPGNTNWARFTTPDLSSLLVRARETMGHSERMALYRRIQTIIHKEVPWIPLYHLKYLTIHKRGLKDIYRDSNGFIQFKDTRVESR